MSIEPGRWNIGALSAAYASGTPFRHVVIDDFLDETLGQDLRHAFDDEAAENLQDEIFDVMASKAPPQHPAFQRLYAQLISPPILLAMSAIVGEQLAGAEMRAYAYLPGHYLLPHADRDDSGRRRVAYAYYVDVFADLAGGELDLFDCRFEGGEIADATIAATILPRRNRCVIFEVSERSLHQVREVTAGGRLSIAGWFVG